MSEKTKILFLCTGNSCRSQMAEGLARALRGTQIEPYSAGIIAKGLNPLAVRAMKEIGIDITGQSSKTVEQIQHVPLDVVVTVCGHAHETCPIFPHGAKVVHVGFDDPPELAKNAASDDEAMPHYRRVRDEIKAFIETLPQSIQSH